MKLLLMVEILHQLRLAIHPIIYKKFYHHPRWLALGFLNHQQYNLDQHIVAPSTFDQSRQKPLTGMGTLRCIAFDRHVFGLYTYDEQT